MIAEESINRLKAIPLADVMSGEVKLKSAGGNLVGLCPFHDEKTGSFNVNVSNNYYHCFGCGASGNVLSYVMEAKGFSFLEAVE